VLRNLIAIFSIVLQIAINHSKKKGLTQVSLPEKGIQCAIPLVFVPMIEIATMERFKSQRTHCWGRVERAWGRKKGCRRQALVRHALRLYQSI